MGFYGTQAESPYYRVTRYLESAFSFLLASIPSPIHFDRSYFSLSSIPLVSCPVLSRPRVRVRQSSRQKNPEASIRPIHSFVHLFGRSVGRSFVRLVASSSTSLPPDKHISASSPSCQNILSGRRVVVSQVPGGKSFCKCVVDWGLHGFVLFLR